MYTNYPFGLCLAHNGNLTNVKDLRETVFAEGRHINTDSVRLPYDVLYVLIVDLGAWNFASRYQLSIISHQLSIIGHRLSIVSYQSSDISYQQRGNHVWMGA